MKECYKPNCNCLLIAEGKAGGPVNHYVCLGAEKLPENVKTANLLQSINKLAEEESKYKKKKNGK
jgi:hypothetical protein